MKIDFNNVRRQAISNFSRLCTALNSRRYDTSTGKLISIEASRIQCCMDDLRSALVGIGATYQKEDPEFICVLDDKSPIPEFNPPDEDEDKTDE